MGRTFLIGLVSLTLILMAGCDSSGEQTDAEAAGGGVGAGGASGASGAGGAGGAGGAVGAGGAGGEGGEGGAGIRNMPPPPEGAITGRIVNEEGRALADMRVLCCSHSICYTESTDADGQYLIGGIPVDDVYKMQAADPTQEYSGLYYYQEIRADEVSELPRDVILPRRESEPVEWLKETGGAVTLAGGALELVAAADSLDYPIGLEEMISGDRIPGTILPPYTAEPWAGRSEQLITFTFNPSPISSMAPVQLRVTADDVGVEGSVWTIYSINPDSAAPDVVGTATVNGDGVLVSDEDAMLLNMLTIILAPRD
jgi:hypothetical protein